MKKMKAMAAALSICAFFAACSSAPEEKGNQATTTGTAAKQETTAKEAKKSLYDRLGGQSAVSAVIDEFVGRVAADARIKKKFAKSDIDRVKVHLKELVCGSTGGPCKYTGLSMTESHKNMGVTEGEFGALVEDLVGALDKFNVPSQEKSELLAILGPLKDQIVEVKSPSTGTALPKEFKPAPALKK
jgi:hemoglobin